MKYNEILFWKVIHNKYIFLNILNQIHTVEWNEYDKIEDININNRKRFKDITSMNWMLKNKQYSLLKCKLENGEFIKINENSLQLLFEIGSGIVKSKKPFIFFGDNEPEKEIILENDIIIIHQVLILLLVNKKDEISKFNILKFAIIKKDLIGINILINEPYSYEITPLNFKTSIFNQIPETAELIIDSKLSVSDEFKLNINDIYSINSDLILIKLLENGYFKLDSSKHPNLVMEDQINALKTKDCNTITGYERLKEIYKLFAITFKNQFSYYKQYFYKYKETIDGLDTIKVMTEYCLEMFDIGILKQLLSSNSNISRVDDDIKVINDNTTIDQIVKKQEPSKEFILLYCSQDLYRNKECNGNIITTIRKIRSKNEYESLVNEIKVLNTKSSNSIISKLPLTWGPIYSDWKILKKVIIKCKEDVDWIIDNIDSDKFTQHTFFNNLFKDIIQIESWELVEYTINKFNGNSHFSSNEKCEQYYSYSLNKAISENNVTSFIQYCSGSGCQINLPKLFIQSLVNNSFDILLLLLECYPIVSDSKNFDLEWSEFLDSLVTFHSFFKVERFTKKVAMITNNSNPDSIIKCITILINQFNEYSNGNGNGSGNDDGMLECIIEEIINYLYRKLIQSTKTTIYQINDCYNTILNSKSIKIIHSNYHTFCYMVIKSIKFQKYLIQLPFLKDEFIKLFFDSPIFTMEFITQGSFNEILDNLINLTLFKPLSNLEFIKKHEKFYKVSLNYNLLYLLEIKRNDLFFNLLDKIENQLKDSTFYTNGFPIINQFNNNYNSNCSCNQLHSKIINNRVFKLSKKVTFASFKVFNNDEWSFQKFISFSSFYSICKTIYTLSGINIKKILKSNHFEIIIHLYYYHLRPSFSCYENTTIGDFFWKSIENDYNHNSSNDIMHIDIQLLNLINNYSFINESDRIVDKDLLESIKSICTSNSNNLLKNLIITKIK